MAVNLDAPSEFGGSRRTKTGLQPRPHRPTASEQLRLTYLNGDPTGLVHDAPDNGESFTGLLPEPLQRAQREAEGVMKKGEIWEEIVAEGNG